MGLIGGHISLGHDGLVGFIGSLALSALLGLLATSLTSMASMASALLASVVPVTSWASLASALLASPALALSASSVLTATSILLALVASVVGLLVQENKMWNSDNNYALQNHFTEAILAAAARTNRVVMTSSATKITNAAIWYYCGASHWFVRKSWLCYVLLPTGRLDSSFFRDTLQSAKHLFSLRLLQMTKYCIMRECENILCRYLYDGDLVFVILKGNSIFKFPKGFLEISSRDLTSFLLQQI
jgi:hypothetical protein